MSSGWDGNMAHTRIVTLALDSFPNGQKKHWFVASANVWMADRHRRPNVPGPASGVCGDLIPWGLLGLL